MQVLTNVVNFFLGLGAPIFVPIIMIAGSIMVGMKIKDAISSGITLGVAFTGMNLLISFMKDSITPAAQAIMTSTGISLPIVDGGWSTMATISWAWPYAFLMFPLLIAVNVVMILLNKTNTINADLWNVWLKIFTAVAVVSITHSVILAFVIAAVQIILELKSSDAHQHRIEKLTGIPGVSVTHATLFFGAILYPIALVLRKIPGLNREFDTDMLKDKVGIFAENHVMGFILGCLFGILAKYSLAQILTTGIKAAAAMTLFPVVAKYFMQALSPISEAVSAFMNKKFEGKTLIVGLDWPILGGCNEIWLAILWSIPFMLIYSMVLPGNFLPLLEEAQTISQVDFFVFEFICSKVKEWADREKQAFPVSVNFSRFSLAQPSFVEQLVKLCDKYGISPGLLEIEITESIRNAPEIDLKELIGKLRQAGFTVALDDFGTEYVNLSLLSSVEFDVLKLDKTMVDDMVNNPKAQAIIESIAGICKKMGIRVVAEGIETEEQMSVLRTCGVETAQGYLFSRPIPVEEYEEKYL